MATFGSSSSTSQIGTFLYSCPGCDATIDVYALGVIFFEMWYPFRTAHERLCVLRQLGQSPPVFPFDFARSHPRQRALIVEMMGARPSAEQVLASPLLPPKMSDTYVAEVLRTVSFPDSPLYSSVAEAMFASAKRLSKLPALSALPHSWLFPLTADDATLDVRSVAARDSVVATVRHILRRHGAVEVDYWMVCPPTDTVSSMLCMGRAGQVFALRDCLVPGVVSAMAQSSSTGPAYAIGKVFDAEGRPRLSACLVFAGCHSPMADAEVVYAVWSILRALPGTSVIRIGHAALTAAAAAAGVVASQYTGFDARTLATLAHLACGAALSRLAVVCDYVSAVCPSLATQCRLDLTVTSSPPFEGGMLCAGHWQRQRMVHGGRVSSAHCGLVVDVDAMVTALAEVAAPPVKLVFVCADDHLVRARLRLLGLLWDAGLATGQVYCAAATVHEQMEAAQRGNAQWLCTVRDAHTVRVRNTAHRSKAEDHPLDAHVAHLFQPRRRRE